MIGLQVSRDTDYFNEMMEIEVKISMDGARIPENHHFAF